MKTVLFSFTLIISISHFSVHAYDETNELNMSGSPVKVIKQYSGMWKGWEDGCINCDKVLTSDRIKKTRRKKREADKKKKVVLPASIRRGYCECNCKPTNNKTTEEDRQLKLQPSTKDPVNEMKKRAEKPESNNINKEKGETSKPTKKRDKPSVKKEGQAPAKTKAE